MRVGANRRAFTLMEVLVASGLALLSLLILAQTMANLSRAKRIQEEVSEQARSLRTLDSRLQALMSSAELEGIHLSSDGKILAVQAIARVSTEGVRQWSPESQVLVYDQEQQLLKLKTVTFAAAGLTSSSATAMELTDSELSALKSATGNGIAEYSKVTAFDLEVNRERAFLSVTSRRAVQDSSRVRQDEPWLVTAYGLRSSVSLEPPRPASEFRTR